MPPATTVKTTEFEELDATELHLVKRGANGFPALVAKAAAEEVDAVKAAQCKTCDGTGKIRDGNVTCPDCDGNGKATNGKASGEDEATKAELSAEDRNALKDSDFAYVDSKGDRHLPIHDEKHVRAALSRFDQTDFDNAADKKKAAKKIVAAAKKFDIEVDPGSAVGEAAGLKAAKAADDGDAAAEDEEPGSPAWEQADAQTMAEAAEMLLQAADRIRAFIARESAELGTSSEAGDYSDLWDGGDALSLVTMALGVVARLSFQEAHEGSAAKAGKVLSAKSKGAIGAAMTALKDLLASAGEADDGGEAAKSPKDVLEMTKEELFAALDEYQAAKAAEKAAADAGAQSAPEETEAQKAEKAAAEAAEKAASDDVVAKVTEGFAKSVEEALRPLADRLATVEKMAAPGGPVRTRTPDALAKSSSREALIAQADSYLALADKTTDRDLRNGYLEKAAEAKKAAEAVTV